MPNDDPPSKSQHAHSAQSPKLRSVFSIPPPLKRVFDTFPRVTYAANELPVRAPRGRDEHTLHIFTTPDAARDGKPSFNPACLKWQAYLRFTGVKFRTTPSSNHASPSGALPFLLPAVSSSEPGPAQDPVPSRKLKKWITSQTTAEPCEASDDVRYEAYASLLDNRIRKAWLYQLYLSPANRSLLHRLYVAPCSSNVFVQMTIAHQLRQAAANELTKACGSDTINEDDIMSEAQEAFEALSTLLGQDAWFFGIKRPGLFDASVFAYTRLVRAEWMQWGESRLAEMLSKYPNLAQHEQRIVRMYF